MQNDDKCFEMFFKRIISKSLSFPKDFIYNLYAQIEAILKT